jgi:soluble lytic murein transglycosylase
LKAVLAALSTAGCARLTALGGACALALAAPSRAWTSVPLDVEGLQETAALPAAGARGAVERLLAERSNLPRDTRARVARAIVEESAEAELDPVFVLALMGVESELDEGAVSSRGAKGLMQLRRATTEYLGEKEQLGLSPQTEDDPALNVRIGIRYLRRLQRAFGSLSVALVAYNAGPHLVSEYRQQGLDLPERFNAYPRKVRAHYRHLMSEVSDGVLRVDRPLHIQVARR